MTGKFGRNNRLQQQKLDSISAEMNRRYVLEAEERRRTKAAATSEQYREAFLHFSAVINKKTLDEPGTANMAKYLAGYEEHGMYVMKEALRNQLEIPVVGPAPELLEGEDREKLMSIISFEIKLTGSLKDIIGAEDVKHIFFQQWFLPMRFPNYFTGDRRPWDSILLCGLPGTGKTSLAKALAAELEAPFIRVIGHKLRCEDYGESESAVQNLFTLAKESAPSVLLIDDIEGLFPASVRSDDHSLTARISYEFFNQIEQLARNPKAVIVMAATNKPDRMDRESLEKFEKLIYMELPTTGDRAHIFKRNLADAEHVLTQTDFELLGKRTEGYTGGDILKVIRNARVQPLNELAAAFHFKKIDTPSKIGEEDITCYWTACDAKDGAGMQMTWRDIPNPEDLVIPKLTMGRMLQAVLRVKPATTGISNDKVMAFRRGLMNEYIIHETEERDTSLNHLREDRKWYDCFLECFVG